MSSSIYDTHAAGMPQLQAEAVIYETAQVIFDRLATKDELHQGLLTMQRRTEDVERQLQGEIAALKHELQLHREEERTREYRMVAEVAGVVATLLGIFAAVLKFL